MTEQHSFIHSDEGLTPEASAQKLFTTANLQYHLSRWIQIILFYPALTQHRGVFRNLPLLFLSPE